MIEDDPGPVLPRPSPSDVPEGLRDLLDFDALRW